MKVRVIEFFKESAIDFQEIEEALTIVKQRKEKESHQLDFLHKVDDERSKGNLEFLCSNESLIEERSSSAVECRIRKSLSIFVIVSRPQFTQLYN